MYQPEIGQAAFGQPWQQLDCPSMVESMLDSLSCAWSVCRNDGNPFSNSGARYDGIKFKAHAYSWADEEQEFNFAWRDVRVSWYKYLGRGTTINRKMGEAEIREMLKECMHELIG